MRITWEPQRSDRIVSYEFDGETITATLDGVTDRFDFSGLPDGELDVSARLCIVRHANASGSEQLVYVNLLAIGRWK